MDREPGWACTLDVWAASGRSPGSREQLRMEVHRLVEVDVLHQHAAAVASGSRAHSHG